MILDWFSKVEVHENCHICNSKLILREYYFKEFQCLTCNYELTIDRDQFLVFVIVGGNTYSLTYAINMYSNLLDMWIANNDKEYESELFLPEVNINEKFPMDLSSLVTKSKRILENFKNALLLE